MTARTFRGRAMLALVVGLALLVLTATPAHGADRIDRVVAGLRASPLFVDPTAAHLLPAEERARIRAALGRLDTPVHVAALPLHADDESYGDELLFLQTLHDRMGTDGVYVVVDTSSEFIYEAHYGIPIELDLIEHEAIWSASENDRTLATRIDLLIQEIADAPPAPVVQPLRRAPQPPAAVAATDTPFYAIGDFWGGLLVVGPLLSLVLFGAGVLVATIAFRVTGRVTASPAARAAAGLGTPGAPARPAPRTLRKLAAAELTALRTALASHNASTDGSPGGTADDNPGRQRAATAYDAAALVWAERTEPVDLLGVLVLARDGLSALRNRRSYPERPCHVNPLHGPAMHEAAVTLSGLPVEPMSLCGACWEVRDTPEALDPRVLVLRDRNGQRPYYLTVSELWGESGFDSVTLDLPERVLERLGVS